MFCSKHFLSFHIYYFLATADGTGLQTFPDSFLPHALKFYPMLIVRLYTLFAKFRALGTVSVYSETEFCFTGGRNKTC